MSERNCLAKACVPFCFSTEMSIVFLGFLMSFADAVYVNELEGVVDLPNALIDRCKNSCQMPARSRTSVDLGTQQSTMKVNWRDDVPYVFDHTETTRDEQIRKFVGSQTSCNKIGNGTYRCTLHPEEYCYAEVRIAFHVGFNSSLNISRSMYSGLLVQQKYYNGSVTEQIYLFGTNLLEPVVRFRLQCMSNTACLRDHLTVVSLQYSCMDQNSVA